MIISLTILTFIKIRSSKDTVIEKEEKLIINETEETIKIINNSIDNEFIFLETIANNSISKENKLSYLKKL